MKKASTLLFYFLIIAFIFSLSPLSVGKTFAADPTVTVSPSTIAPFQSFTVTVNNCNPNEIISVGYKRPEDYTNEFLGIALPTDNQGSYTGSADNIEDAGRYTVTVNCKGQNWFFPDAIITQELMGSITIRHQVLSQTETKLIIEGCPPNSEVLLDWRRGLNFDQLEYTSDASGVTEIVFRESGVYTVDAACGGENSSSYRFAVGDDAQDFPTQPPPPPPPCNIVDGKCASVETAIGTIRTDGPGIIYSAFVVMLSMSGGILVLVIMYAGYLLVTSAGKPEQIQKAREILIAGIVGFLFIIFSYVIFGTITDNILNLPGFRAGECLPNDASCVP